MNYGLKFSVYKKPDGTITHKAKGNTLVLTAGATISRAEADRLGIPALEAQSNERAANTANPLADLKPAVLEAAPAEETVTGIPATETEPEQTDKAPKGRKDKAASSEPVSTETQEA
ncbi:hypothetical protein EON80_15655 [bacterium]|nr:MAG: hypothetical protein EON80_15655 [bacterium]